MDDEKVASGCALTFFVLLSLALILWPLWGERLSPIPEKSDLIEREVEGPLEFKVVSSGKSIGRMIFADGISISFGWHDLERCRLALESQNRKVILIVPEESKTDRKVWEIRELYEDRPPAFAFSYEEARRSEVRQAKLMPWLGWFTAALTVGMVVLDRYHRRKHEELVERAIGGGEKRDGESSA